MTKRQLEDQISNAISKFEKECMGRGPKGIKTKVMQNHILIINDGFLNKSEQMLAESKQGIKLVKNMRTALFESSREQLRELIQGIIDCDVISIHSDVSTKTGEKIIVLTINESLEKYYPNQ